MCRPISVAGQVSHAVTIKAPVTGPKRSVLIKAQRSSGQILASGVKIDGSKLTTLKPLRFRDRLARTSPEQVQGLLAM